MTSLRETILTTLQTIDNEAELIARFDVMASLHGKEVFRVVFQLLASLDLPDGEAEEDWRRIIGLREYLSRAIGREVSLRTAICDYFCTVQKSFKNPKVVELHIFEKTLRDSSTDALTGLFNRHYFDTALAREIALARRHDTDISLLFFDIDDFKHINDTHGHLTGDRVLRQVSDIILAEKRTSDIAARYGGEELVVVLPRTTNMDAWVLGERIRHRVEQEAFRADNGQHIHCTVSGGLVSYPMDATDAESLIQYADSALYRAKGSGKNNIALFTRDRRRYLRMRCTRKIDVKELGFTDAPASVGESKNIGLGGVLFEHTAPFPLGARIQVRMSMAAGMPPLLLIGTVIRAEMIAADRYDIGISISFQEMDKIGRMEISKYLAAELQRNASPPPDSAPPPSASRIPADAHTP